MQLVFARRWVERDREDDQERGLNEREDGAGLSRHGRRAL